MEITSSFFVILIKKDLENLIFDWGFAQIELKQLLKTLAIFGGSLVHLLLKFKRMLRVWSKVF